MPSNESSQSIKTTTLFCFKMRKTLCMREDTFFQVIASTSLQSEQEQKDDRGQDDPSHCADYEPLGGERGHGHGAGRVGYPDSQNKPGFSTEISVIQDDIT